MNVPRRAMKRCIRRILPGIILYVVIHFFYFQFHNKRILPTPPPSYLQTRTQIVRTRTQSVLDVVNMNTKIAVQPDKFTTIIQPSLSHLCIENGTKQYLLLMVISTPHKLEPRNVIRSIFSDYMHKWDSSIVQRYPEFHHGESIKAYFFLGNPTNDSTMIDVQEEANLYQDIILDDFPDTYMNLTVKTIRMLKWVEQHCANVRYTIKVDDDVFLNVPAMLNELSKFDTNSSSGQDLIAGREFKNTSPTTDPRSKWFTPEIVWSTKYPDYAVGACYILGSNIRKSLYQNALKTPLFHIEDTFITGIVRHTLSRHINITSFPLDFAWHYHTFRDFYSTRYIATIPALHKLEIEKARCFAEHTDPDTIWPYLPLFPMGLLC